MYPSFEAIKIYLAIGRRTRVVLSQSCAKFFLEWVRSSRALMDGRGKHHMRFENKRNPCNHIAPHKTHSYFHIHVRLVVEVRASASVSYMHAFGETFLNHTYFCSLFYAVLFLLLLMRLCSSLAPHIFASRTHYSIVTRYTHHICKVETNER